MKKETKTIIITGASSGIGRETAFKLAKEGHKVFAGVRKKIDKDELEKLNPNITAVYIDVTNPSSIDKAFWFIIKKADKIDVLINNAGIAVAGAVEFLPIKKIKEQFDVNTFGALQVTQKFMPFLKNGLIINISSMASYGIFPFIAPYCASKRAMDILFNSLLIENKDNIKVVSVKPESVKTPIWNKSVNSARKTFDLLNEAAKNKYKKEFNFLEKNALKNNNSAKEIGEVAELIIKIINSKNPKCSYNLGKTAVFTQIISLLPDFIVNFFIKLKLSKI